MKCGEYSFCFDYSNLLSCGNDFDKLVLLVMLNILKFW